MRVHHLAERMKMLLKNKKIIRWGIIGCGAVTEVKSGPAYQKTSGFELTAVMRRNLALAQDYANRHNVNQYTSDAEDIINDPAIDAIYIATPPDSHKYYALMVAKAGKPCCIEKPLSPSYQDSLAIVQAFKQQSIPLWVAYYRRSLPRFNQVKAWVEANKIGSIRHISWQLSKPANPLDLSGEKNWRTDRTIAPGGYFDDLASHGLDLFTYLLGNIVQAKGLASNQQSLYSSHDAITACWQHTNGATGAGSWNFGCRTRKDNVVIHGSEGEIEFSVFDETPIYIESNDFKEELFIANPEHIQLFHVKNMYKQISENYTHPSTGDSALHTSWVMQEILSQ